MITVYGLKCSYFTGKLEGYLRVKGIPYAFEPMTVTHFTKTMPEKTGAVQMPGVELPDGRWMADTSPMIDWFETQYPDHPILPLDPVLAFACYLIEDYADEWLWRPAMHYRWSYPHSAKLLRHQIVEEMAGKILVPKWLLRMRTEHRQHRYFVQKDGVNRRTWTHVEQSYLRLLEILQPVFANRSFLLGNRPSLADIGLFGPLFRHFAMDPVPGAIMRETAPAVMAWVYRLWATRMSDLPQDDGQAVPGDLSLLFREIGKTHLEALCANAQAYSEGRKRYNMTIQGVPYTDIPVSRYRVWCLERLQQRFLDLDAASLGAVARWAARHGCEEPLWRMSDPNSGYDPDGQVPFNRSIAVYSHVMGEAE